MNSNPIQLARTIDETLKRYIPTTLSISHNFPELRKEFHKILQQQTLVKGPYVEALPDFEKGASLESLSQRSANTFMMAFIASSGNSVAPPSQTSGISAGAFLPGQSEHTVATGTGSGKTETFLYRSRTICFPTDPFRPGVRALLIYP